MFYAIEVIVALVLLALGVILCCVCEFRKDMKNSIGQVIGILLILLCGPWVYTLIVDTGSHASWHAWHKNINYGVSDQPAEVVFDGGTTVKWRPQDNMLWVAIKTKKGDKEETFVVRPAPKKEGDSAVYTREEFSGADQVTVWYGTANGPSAPTIKKNPSAK